MKKLFIILLTCIFALFQFACAPTSSTSESNSEQPESLQSESEKPESQTDSQSEQESQSEEESETLSESEQESQSEAINSLGITEDEWLKAITFNGVTSLTANIYMQLENSEDLVIDQSKDHLFSSMMWTTKNFKVTTQESPTSKKVEYFAQYDKVNDITDVYTYSESFSSWIKTKEEGDTYYTMSDWPSFMSQTLCLIDFNSLEKSGDYLCATFEEEEISTTYMIKITNGKLTFLAIKMSNIFNSAWQYVVISGVNSTRVTLPTDYIDFSDIDTVNQYSFDFSNVTITKLMTRDGETQTEIGVCVDDRWTYKLEDRMNIYFDGTNLYSDGELVDFPMSHLNGILSDLSKILLMGDLSCQNNQITLAEPITIVLQTTDNFTGEQWTTTLTYSDLIIDFENGRMSNVSFTYNHSETTGYSYTIYTVYTFTNWNSSQIVA